MSHLRIACSASCVFVLSALAGALSCGTARVDGPSRPMLAGWIAAGRAAEIPQSVLDDIRDRVRVFYGRTGHGEQITSGLAILEAEDADRWAPPEIEEHGGDLGSNGSTDWADVTREFLSREENEDVNVVMWSWCGGVTDNTPAGIRAYLEAMAELERDFPDVTFVYMTGHLDGTGLEGDLWEHNDMIREWCREHRRVLLDFADVDAYDPDGVLHADDDDSCNWCGDWCEDNECPACDACPYTNCLNCRRKALDFWWILAGVVGWSP